MERNCEILAERGNDSELKKALNAAVGSLFQATEDYLRPHACLNGKEGVAILRSIADDPTTQTEFSIFCRLAYDNGHVWLNVSFGVFAEDIVRLTPRQTGYIVASLPSMIRIIVLQRVRTWCLEHFLPKIRRGLDRVSDHFLPRDRDLLLPDAFRNRIFDLHRDIGNGDNFHTEAPIISQALFFGIFPTELAGCDVVDRMIDIEKSAVTGAVPSVMRALMCATSEEPQELNAIPDDSPEDALEASEGVQG